MTNGGTRVVNLTIIVNFYEARLKQTIVGVNMSSIDLLLN